jgi:spermidine synthase
MQHFQELDRTRTPDGLGELVLRQRGQEFSIQADGRELMNSREHASEDALGRLGCEHLISTLGPRVLVGGLGMGFALAASCATLPPGASISVAELSGAVIRWNRGPMGELAGRPLHDARVVVHEADVVDLLAASTASFDAIMLDVDNGPEGLTQASNRSLYSRAGLARSARALTPTGVLSIWSAAPHAAFQHRLGQCGFSVATHVVRSRPNHKGARHTLWIATKRG